MYFVKPVSGRRVRHPDNKKVLDESGCKIPAMNTYWHRRVKDGDVIINEIVSAPPVAEKKSRNKEQVEG